SATFTVDNTPPALTSLLYTSSNSNSGFAKIGDAVTLSFGTNEAIQAPVVSIAGHAVAAISTGGNNYSASYTMTGGDNEGRIPFNLTITDITGNQGNYTDVAAGDDITFDMTLPTATISAPSVSQIGGGGAGTVTYSITYADTNFNTSNLTNAGITLNPSGTATGTVAVTGGGTSYTVTISNITGLGTLGITLAGGYAFDSAGNTDPGAGPAATFNVLSSNDDLSSLKVSEGVLSPTFASGSTSYSDAVGNTITSVTVTPATADPNAVITVNGAPLASGTASTAIALNVGDNIINIVTTAPDGVSSKTYTVTVTRAGSSNTNLTNLKINAGAIPLTPSFIYTTTSYTASVPNATASIKITPAIADANATVKINGTMVNSGTASAAIPLNFGANIITTVVTAQNGTSTKTYTITVTRPALTNANLAGLKLSAGTLSHVFSSGTN